MATNAAQRTVTFPPRTHVVPMSVRINDRITEQQQTRESLARTPIVALSLGKVSQHLIIAEHQAETLTEKLALGTYLCGDNRALLDEALECATRVVGALSFCKKKAVDHETRIFAEYEARELAIVEESQPKATIPAAEIDGGPFVESPSLCYADARLLDSIADGGATVEQYDLLDQLRILLRSSSREFTSSDVSLLKDVADGFCADLHRESLRALAKKIRDISFVKGNFFASESER